MTKTNHHYVPQFFLRLFASDKHLSEHPRRIHLFNIKNTFLKENVSIKDQCYKRKFYGDADELEDALSEFEGACSWLLSQIIKLERLPPSNLPAYQLLLNFILVQRFRTKREADIQNEMWDGFLKAVYEEDVEQFTEVDWKKTFGENAKPLKKDELDNLKFRMKDPVILSLSLFRLTSVA